MNVRLFHFPAKPLKDFILTGMKKVKSKEEEPIYDYFAFNPIKTLQMKAPGIAHRFLTLMIALVWMVNGLFCKILDFVPRHQQIVARILGDQHAWLLTKSIGIAEILMVVWILSRIKPRACAIFQITIIGTMNVIEFIFAPDLLLFGKLNIAFAFLFIILIYVNEFALAKPRTNPPITEC